MKNFKKIRTTLFFGAYLIISINLILPISAQAVDVNFSPQVGIPKTEFEKGTPIVIGKEVKNAITGDTVMRSDLLARYISAFYSWGLSIVGVISVLMLMAAGVIWLTSAGDSGKITNAKKMIEGSLLGGALLIGSWFLLNTINPNLTKLPALETVIIDKVVTGCCTEDGRSKMVIGKECKGEFDENKKLNSNFQCEAESCCVTKILASGVQKDYCFSALSANCTGQKIQKNCSEIPSCQAATSGQLSCIGVDNGDIAVGTPEGSQQPFFCYNETVYPYTAKQGEPCGTKGDNQYGVCIKESEDCSDENNVGGRFCDSASSLQCCLDDGMW